MACRARWHRILVLYQRGPSTPTLSNPWGITRPGSRRLPGLAVHCIAGPLLDASELRRTLTALLPSHAVGADARTGARRLRFAVGWSVEMLDEQVLLDLEASLAAHVTVADAAAADAAAAGSGARGARGSSEDELLHAAGGVGLPVSAADAVLAKVAAAKFPGETVIFVVAPRKARVFRGLPSSSATATAAGQRRRYHYVGHQGYGAAPALGSATVPRCVSAWVGSGRFLALDLASGPCEWGDATAALPASSAPSATATVNEATRKAMGSWWGQPRRGALVGPTVPYVGDGAQGPRGVLGALGLRPAFDEGQDGDEDGNEDGDNDDGAGDNEDVDGGGDEDDDVSSGGGELRADRPALAAQVADLCRAAVTDVLAPPASSSHRSAPPAVASRVTANPSRECFVQSRHAHHAEGS